MAVVYAVHAVWRLWLYVLYGVAALMVYRLVFSLDPPLPGYVAVGIVLVAVGKDVFDHFKESSFWSKVSYKFVDHNPFNIVLLWGLLAGVFTIQDQNLFYAVVGISSFDLLLDGYVDFKKQPSAHVMVSVFLIVALALATIHLTVGISGAIAWLEDMAWAVLSDSGTLLNDMMSGAAPG